MKTSAVVFLLIGAVLFGAILDRLALTRPEHWFLLVWLAVSAAGKMHIALGGRRRNIGTAFSLLFVASLVSAALVSAGQDPGIAKATMFTLVNYWMWCSWVIYDILAIAVEE